MLLLFNHLVVSDSATPWTAAQQTSLSLTISRSLPKFMSIALVMSSSHLILWHPLFPLPSIFASTRDFSNELVIRIRWPSNHFTLSISPFSDYSGLISLKIDWFDFPDFPDKNTGVGCQLLLQLIFPTQELNPYLLHWQADFFFF